MGETQYFLYRLKEGLSKDNKPYMRATIVVENEFRNDSILILFVPKEKQRELKELEGSYINDYVSYLVTNTTDSNNNVIQKITYYIKK